MRKRRDAHSTLLAARRRGLTIAVLANLETPGGDQPAAQIFTALARIALAG